MKEPQEKMDSLQNSQKAGRVQAMLQETYPLQLQQPRFVLLQHNPERGRNLITMSHLEVLACPLPLPMDF